MQTIAPTFLVLSLHRCAELVMAASRSGSFTFLPRTCLRSTIGLDSLGFLFQIVGAAVLAASSTLSTSHTGAGLAVAGLVIQSLTLALTTGIFTLCGLWDLGYVRALYLFSFWTATEEGNKEELEVFSTSQKKRLRLFIVGTLAPLVLVMWCKANRTCVATIIALMSTLIRTLLQAVVLAGGREGEQLRIQSLYQGEFTLNAIMVMQVQPARTSSTLRHSPYTVTFTHFMSTIIPYRIL